MKLPEKERSRKQNRSPEINIYANRNLVNKKCDTQISMEKMVVPIIVYLLLRNKPPKNGID